MTNGWICKCGQINNAGDIECFSCSTLKPKKRRMSEFTPPTGYGSKALNDLGSEIRRKSGWPRGRKAERDDIITP